LQEEAGRHDWALGTAKAELGLARPGFIGAPAGDRRDLGAHRAQIDRELAAMVNAVVVDEAEVEHGREVESEKIHRRVELSGVMAWTRFMARLKFLSYQSTSFLTFFGSSLKRGSIWNF